MYIIATSAVVNIVLNLLLIPSCGITGAAIATLLSYLVLVIWPYVVTSKTLAIPVPWFSLGKFGLIALSMYFVVDLIQLSNLLLTLVLQIITGVLFYATAVFLVDIRSRDAVLALLPRLRSAKKQWV
jgi:O-antigen/teichoic acid export membrane protein